MFTEAIALIQAATHVGIIQAENPDGDSLGSSLALEDLCEEQGKRVSMYCTIATPGYLRYFTGWDRVTTDFPFDADLLIIVDTSVETLMLKTLAIPGVRHALETRPVLVLDHHNESAETLQFDHTLVLDNSAVATGQMVQRLASEANWQFTPSGAESALGALLSDTLGLTTQNVDAAAYKSAAALVAAGANPAALEERRREFMKKPADILDYKADLIKRIEYNLDGALAIVHVPWEDIQAYSDRYNPSVLVIDEMRLVEGVQVACAIKTYPDGKCTGKLRTNLPIADVVAGYFGGGGHSYSAGFKVFESYDTVVSELITATRKALDSHES